MSKQLLKAIPELVQARVISEETGQNIIRYYQLKRQTSPNALTIILGILGALLVGSGILLMIAHNWDDLPPSVKTVLAFLPLLIGQIMCAYTIWKKREVTAWRECSSIVLFFGIGASIALISQIYQLSGSLSSFLLTWMLLALPLVYLMSSSTVSLLCLAGITWYASVLGYADRPDQIPFMYPIVLLAMAPHYYMTYIKKPDSNYFYLFNWLLLVSLTILLGSFVIMPGDWFEWVFLLYLIYFCTCYLAGRSAGFSERRWFGNPFLIIGNIGILVILFTWSFDFLWQEVTRTPHTDNMFANPLLYLLSAGGILAIWLAWNNARQTNAYLLDPAGYSFALFLLLLLGLKGSPPLAVFIINVWIFLIAIFYIRKGTKEDHLGILNFGLIILAVLSICRFFDETIPFIWRGIFFVGTGAGFFIANYALVRKRKQSIGTGDQAV